MLSFRSIWLLPCNSLPSLSKNGGKHTFSSTNLSETTHTKQTTVNHHSYYSNALKFSAKMRLLEQGKQLHSHIIKSGHDPTLSLQNQLLNLYIKCRHFKDGYKLFDEMPKRNIVSWNIMISGCRSVDSFSFFKRMLVENNVERPDYITFASLLSLCMEFRVVETGKMLHCWIVKVYFCTNHVVCSALLDLYGKCGLVDDARLLFDGTSLYRDLVLWNVMVSCYTLNGLGEHALGVFGLLRSDGLNGDEFTFSSLVCSCGIIGSCDVGRQIHGLVIRLSFDKDVLVSSALIDMYVKCDSVVDARQVFERMTCKNVVSWTTMIVGYGRQGDGKETVFLLKNMLQGGYGPDELTLASVLSCCANLAAMYEIAQVHSLAAKRGLENHLSIGNALITAYSKSGSIDGAFQSFSSIKDPNLITWTSIIGAYAFHGLPRHAIRVFEEMLSRGVKPDEIAFVGILSACSHGGLVDEGLRYFSLMTTEYQIFPGLEHFACLIDLLGRAGHLNTASDIMENMPVEPGANVLGAFVGACKAHGNARLGILAAEKLFKLEPQDPVSYTLMSNIYASVGRWTNVARVRKLMKDRCDFKVPGCSWIEIGGRVHTFVSSDSSHPQATDMYTMSDILFYDATSV